MICSGCGRVMICRGCGRVLICSGVWEGDDM